MGSGQAETNEDNREIANNERDRGIKLKIPTPKKLKNVDNITIVRAFVQSIKV